MRRFVTVIIALYSVVISFDGAAGNDAAQFSNQFYYFDRDRERYDPATNSYQNNLNHSTFIAALNVDNWSLLEQLTFKAGVYLVHDFSVEEEDKVHQENEFSFAADRWGDNYHRRDNGRSKSGVSYRSAAVKWRPVEALSLSAGYDQFYLPGLIGTNWSFIPGTSRGVSLAFSSPNSVFRYVYVDRYKAPWFKKVQRFSTENAWVMGTDKFDIRYLHGVSASTKVSDYSVDVSIAESEGYMQSQFFKFGYVTAKDATHRFSYQLYRSDTDSGFDTQNNGYQGLAWLQALTYQFSYQQYQLSTEATYVKAQGALGNYLPRLTRGYGNSQGALEIWWDLRSDWNHHNEKAVYIGLRRTLEDWVGTPGWSFKLSGAYGWDAEYEPSGLKDGKESAWAVDLIYEGRIHAIENIKVHIHYMEYKNHQDELGDWAFPNMFASETDLQIKLSIPIGS